MNAGLLYREGTVAGASPVALVTRLYEQMIQDLRQAVTALEHNDIELRTKKINHAILIIGYLQSTLNFAASATFAETLKSFYDALRARLVRAQFAQSKSILQQQITDLLTVREAWVEVEHAEKRNSTSAADYAAANTVDSEPAPARVEWKG